MQVSIEKAKKDKLFYFVVTGVIFNPNLNKCLILKRSTTEIAHPGLWGVVGGKLEWSDLEHNSFTRQNFDIVDWEGLVEKLLQREAKEESGLAVANPQYLGSVVFVRPDKVPVVCIKFGVIYQAGEVKIPAEFDEYAWVGGKEVEEYETIQGIKEEVQKTIQLFSPLP